MKITEGLKTGDLEGIVEKVFSVDQHKSKMGEDKDVCVVTFTCGSQAGAKDLESFAEKGYKKVLDADATPGTMSDGKYRVFIEFPRDEKLDLYIGELLEDLKKLTNIETFEFTYHKSTAIPIEASRKNLAELPTTPEAYEMRVNEMRVSEARHFFDKYDMMECKINENTMSVKKAGAEQELKFEIHKFGSTDAIMKETQAFKIDMDSIAECTHLTKYFGTYDITKTNENQFIFTKGDQSALLSKSGW